jgi:hypothetical protein
MAGFLEEIGHFFAFFFIGSGRDWRRRSNETRVEDAFRVPR